MNSVIIPIFVGIFLMKYSFIETRLISKLNYHE